MGKVNLFYCQLELDCEKQRQNLKYLRVPHFFQVSTLVLHSRLLCLVQPHGTRASGMGWDQSIIAPLCCSLFLQFGVLHGLSGKIPAPMWILQGLHLLSGKPSPAWAFLQDVGESLLRGLQCFLPSAFPHLGAGKAGSHTFPLTPHCPCRVFAALTPSASAVGSAVSCGGCVGASGTGCVWHGAACGSLRLLLLPSWGTCIPHGFSPALCSQPC